MNTKQAQHDRAVLPRIQELKAEGRSLREIADHLQREGVPAPRRGGQWSHIAVGRILDRADRTPPKEASPPPPQAEQPPHPTEQTPPTAEQPAAPTPPRQERAAQIGNVVDQLDARVQDKLGAIDNQLDQFSARVQDKLGAIEDQLDQRLAALTRFSTWLWLRPVCVGLLICLGLTLGSWGLIEGIAARIESQRQTLTEGKQDIERQQATVRELKQDTWGVGLHEEADGRFLILPENTAKRWWNLGDQPAVKLPDK